MIRFFYAWGDPTVMSEHKIHKKIMEQSKVSNYNWLASADELVEVCNQKGFNRKYAIDIKCAILNCYAGLYLNSDVARTDGVFMAFNDLLEEFNRSKDNNAVVVESDNIKEACTNFLNAYIFRLTIWEYFGNTSESFYNAKHEYSKNKIAELMSRNFVDFDNLSLQIREEYKAFIDENISNGTITYEPIKLLFVGDEDEELNGIKQYGGSVLKKELKKQ